MSVKSGNEMSFDKQIFYTGNQYLDPKMKYCETKKELNDIQKSECFTGREVTVLKDEDNDWRIHLVAPLSERHYQRQDKNKWVLYEKGQGFA